MGTSSRIFLLIMIPDPTNQFSVISKFSTPLWYFVWWQGPSYISTRHKRYNFKRTTPTKTWYMMAMMKSSFRLMVLGLTVYVYATALDHICPSPLHQNPLVPGIHNFAIIKSANRILADFRHILPNRSFVRSPNLTVCTRITCFCDENLKYIDNALLYIKSWYGFVSVQQNSDKLQYV